jgi:hypothetical protein
LHVDSDQCTSSHFLSMIIPTQTTFAIYDQAFVNMFIYKSLDCFAMRDIDSKTNQLPAPGLLPKGFRSSETCRICWYVVWVRSRRLGRSSPHVINNREARPVLISCSSYAVILGAQQLRISLRNTLISIVDWRCIPGRVIFWHCAFTRQITHGPSFFSPRWNDLAS